MACGLNAEAKLREGKVLLSERWLSGVIRLLADRTGLLEPEDVFSSTVRAACKAEAAPPRQPRPALPLPPRRLLLQPRPRAPGPKGSVHALGGGRRLLHGLRCAALHLLHALPRRSCCGLEAQKYTAWSWASVPGRVQSARAAGLQRSVRVPSGFCLS